MLTIFRDNEFVVMYLKCKCTLSSLALRLQRHIRCKLTYKTVRTKDYVCSLLNSNDLNVYVASRLMTFSFSDLSNSMNFIILGCFQ